jgi:hypothetical protein
LPTLYDIIYNYVKFFENETDRPISAASVTLRKD